MIGRELWDIALELFGPVLTASAVIVAGIGIWILIGRVRRARRPRGADSKTQTVHTQHIHRRNERRAAIWVRFGRRDREGPFEVALEGVVLPLAGVLQ